MTTPPRQSDRELQIRVAMLDCKHFTGAHRETCMAGVKYRSLVGGEDMGWIRRLPCLGSIAPDPRFPQVTCDKRELRTREEAEQVIDAQEAGRVRTMTAFRAAHEHAKAAGLRQGHGGSGRFKCPICPDGILSYSVASVNGHMHAACSTDTCVRWME